MNIGRAAAIFRNIRSEQYSASEKVQAIQSVIGMETLNSVTKANLLEVMQWLLDQHYKQGMEIHHCMYGEE